MATWPLAAGLLSTMTGWPRRGESFSAIVRPIMSIELPAGAVMMNLVGLSGQVCADDVIAMASAAMAVRQRRMLEHPCAAGITDRRARRPGTRATPSARAGGSLPPPLP